MTDETLPLPKGIPTGKITKDFYNVSLLTDEDLEEIFNKPLTGIYQVPNRTNRPWFHDKVIQKASAMMFTKTFPYILVAFGDHAMRELASRAHLGFVVRTMRETPNPGD